MLIRVNLYMVTPLCRYLPMIIAQICLFVKAQQVAYIPLDTTREVWYAITYG